MNDVKCEKGSGVCRGCLSSDRKISPLVHVELYTTLLNKNRQDMDTSVVSLCWECEALMRRISRFQLQAQEADKMLAESLESIPVKKSLSKLIMCHKQDYDTIIMETYGTPDKLGISDIDIKEEKSDNNTEFKKNQENDSHEAGYLDDDYFDLKVSSDEEHINPDNVKIEAINQKSNKGKDESNTIEFVAASLVTSRRSARIKDVIDNLKHTQLKQPKSKIVKRKKRPFKGRLNLTLKKADEKAVSIKIENEIPKPDTHIEIDDSHIEIDDSHIEIDVPNTDKNENNEETGVNEESDKMVADANAIMEDVKMENSDSDGDSRNDDSDYCEFEEPMEKKPAVKPDKPKWHGKKKNHFIKKEIIKYVYTQLEEFFSKVEVEDGMLEELLKHEPSYTTKQRPISCQYCGWVFEVPKHLVRHQNVRHKQIRKQMSIKDPNNPQYYRYTMYRCTICNKVLRVEHTEAHMKFMHRTKFTCTECDAVLWDQEAADQHAVAHKNVSITFQCKFCKAVKKRRSYLTVHIQTWHTPVTCEDCGEEFPMRKLLIKHQESAHPDPNPELRYCVQCDIQFRSVFAYQSHLRYTKTHRTGPAQSFPCSECSAVLVTKYSLDCHIDRFHRGETRFQCTHCGKFYARKNGLQTHIERAHLKVSKPKDKICTYCGRGFSNNRILIHHVRTHTGERPHQCTFCTAAFAQPFPLKKHIATVHRHATGSAQSTATDARTFDNDSNSTV